MSEVTPLEKNEKLVMDYLSTELSGCELKPITFLQLADATKLNESAVFYAVNGLVKKKILVKKKLSGFRTHFYGFWNLDNSD